MCVRTVRIVLAIEWQAVGADGRFIAMAATIRMQANRPRRLCREPLTSFGFEVGVDDADGTDGLPPASSGERPPDSRYHHFPDQPTDCFRRSP